MSLWENLRIAFNSLKANPLRSFLALLGIVIGVFGVTTMVSLGQIASASINANLESVAGRSIIVQPDFQAGMNLKRLREEDLRELSALPVTVNPQTMVSGQYEKKPGERLSVSIYGTVGDLPTIDKSIRLAKGRYFTHQETLGGASVAVLNPSAARELVKGDNPLGKRFRVYYPESGRGEFVVVGVIEELPAMFGGATPQIYTPIQYLWQTHPDTQRNRYDFVLLKLRDGYETKSIEERVKKILARRYTAGTFRVDSVESFQQVLGSVTTVLQVLLGAIAGLSLLVGGIGIMNIMLVSVTERTREIGLRKALGATSGQIRQQFLIEAVVLTVMGGAVGVLLSVLLLLLLVATVPFFKVFIFSPITAFIALAVSVGVGLVFGVMPASRAAKLDPIESLRYE